MDLLIVPVPLFNRDIAVEAYFFRYQKGNDLLTSSRNTRALDGAMNSPALETLNNVGLDAFTMGKPIFTPINNLMLLVNLEKQSNIPPEKVIFLLDSDAKSEEPYLGNMRRLKGLGYRFAIQKIGIASKFDEILKLCDYIFLNNKLQDSPRQIALAADIRKYNNLSVVMTHIDNMTIFDQLPTRGISMYEGRFIALHLQKG